MVHVAALEVLLAKMTIHSSQKAQISALIWDEALTKVAPKYVNYADVFSFNLVIELLEITGINIYTMNLEEVKQSHPKHIYSFGLVELKTLKIYIETHLKTGFIQSSKSLADASIQFDKKLKSSLWLNVNYWGLNNLIIKNQYPLPLICEAFNQLGRTKQCT